MSLPRLKSAAAREGWQPRAPHLAAAAAAAAVSGGGNRKLSRVSLISGKKAFMCVNPYLRPGGVYISSARALAEISLVVSRF